MEGGVTQGSFGCKTDKNKAAHAKGAGWLCHWETALGLLDPGVSSILFLRNPWKRLRVDSGVWLPGFQSCSSGDLLQVT